MQVGQLSWDATIQDSEFHAQINRIENGLISLTDRAKKSGDELEDVFKRAAVAAASYFSVQATTNFIRSIIETRGEFQQLEIAFTTMLRSKEKADALMKDVVQFAATTPFDLKQVASGTKQLLAYGFAAEDMQENLSMLGNVASGVGSQISDIIYLYGTLRASGRVTQMDINQFAGRGIPIYEELARVLKVNVDQVRDFVSAGKVGFKDIEASFRNMTAESGMFYNLMQEQSKSLTGQIANLQDAWESMLNEMGQSQEGLFSKSIEGVAYLVENYQKILDMIKLLIVSYGVYRAALIVNTLALSGMSAMELLHYGRLVMVQRAQRLLNATILANPYVAAAAAATILAAAMYTFADRSTQAEKAQAKLNDVMHDAETAVVEQTIKLKDLVDAAKDETKSKGEREKAIRNLNSISPEYLGNLTLEKIGTKEATEAIDEYIVALKKKAKEEALYNTRVELHKEIIAIDAGERDNLISDIVGFGKAFVGGSWAKHIAKTRQQAKEAAEETLKAIDDEVKKTLSENTSTEPIVDEVQNKKYWEDKKTEAQSALDALSIIDAQGEKGKALLKSIAEFDEKIAAYANKKTKGSKAENNLLSLLKDINDAERKALQSGLEKEESEIDRINERYDNLEKRAKELGLTPAVFARIDNARNTETGNEKQKQEIDDYKKTIDRQKEIFDAFEEHKIRIGEDRAKGMYSAEIGEFDNYIDYLKAELKKLEGDNSIGASLKRTSLNESLVKAEVDDSKKQAETYVKIIEQAQTFNQKILKIETDYQKAISENKVKLSHEELAVLNQKKEDEINTIKEAELQKLDAYKRSGEEILLFTRNQVQEQIKAMRSLLDNDEITGELRTQIESKLKGLEGVLKLGIDESNIKELERHREEIIKQIENRKKLKITTPENEKELQRLLDQLAEIQGKIVGINETGLKKFFEYLKGDAATVAQGLSDDLGYLSGSFHDLSSALGGVDTEAGYTLDTIGRLVEVGSDAAGAFASFASGDIVGGVTKTIKAVSGLFAIGKKVKEMNAAARKEVADFYENAIKGEKAYRDALKARELQIIRNNKAVLDGIRDEIKLRTEMNNQASKEANDIMRKLSGMDYVSGETYKHGTWFRKAKVTKHYESLRGKSFEDLSLLLEQGKLEGDAKVLVERLVELEQQGFDTTKVMADLAKEVEAIFTGTTSDNLSSSLLNMFKEGKTGVQDLANFFESTMQDAALSIFKNKVLDAAMAGFYEKFAESAMSGDILTDKEIADLKLLFDSITEGVTDQFENLEKITGLSFGKIAKDIGVSLESIQDGLADLFADPTAKAEDFGKKFEDIMKQSILNSFKKNALTKELEAFYNQFTELADSGNQLTKDEIAQLRFQYDKIIKDGQDKFKQMEAITGVEFKSNETAASGLGGAIRAQLTEETGSELTGLFRSYYEVVKSLLALQEREWKIANAFNKICGERLLAIQQNTLRTADNTDRLENIENHLARMAKNTDPDSFASKRAYTG